MRRAPLWVVFYLLVLGMGFAGASPAEAVWRMAQARGPTPQTAPGPDLERTPAAAADASELSLRDALALALKANPELAAFAQEVRAIEAAVPQADVLPNPVLQIGADNLGNARKAEAGDRAVFLQIGQLIELGGKRAARTTLAETGRELASLDYDAKRIDLLTRVAQRFVDLLASQQREALAAESVRLAQQVAQAVAKRVQAGRVSPVEETKARLALAGTEVEFEQARRERIAARKVLGALWGEPEPRFGKAAGDLERIVPLPDYEVLAARVRDNPELARWQTEIARRQGGIDAERAKAVPDVTVSAGVSRFSQFGDSAYMVSVSVPLPVFDRNRGGILEASRRLDKAADEQRAAQARLLSELAQTYQRLAAIAKEIETLRTALLPGALSAYEAATQGYQLGKFGFLDVLDAQRTLFQTRSQNLRALADYQRGVGDIERLIGGALDAPTTNRQ